MARHDHELPYTGAGNAPPIAIHSFSATSVGSVCVPGKSICSPGNADRLQRRKVTGWQTGQHFAHPRQIGLADQDIGFERQMRAMLLGGCQRQHRDPARGLAPAIWPVDVGPAGAERLRPQAECFFGRNGR
jgi:hypothetical protein